MFGLLLVRSTLESTVRYLSISRLMQNSVNDPTTHLS